MLESSTEKSDMPDIKKVKEEPLDEFVDALRTLASAAVEHDSLLLSKEKLQNELVPDSQQKRVLESTQLQSNQTLQPQSMNTLVPSSGPLRSRPIDISVLNPRWFDVGIMRQPSCFVNEFYFTKGSIDHSADTSDYLPDYRGLTKLALLPGVAYKFRVAAVNSCGIGEWSDVSAFKTCSPGYPGAPCLICVTKSSDGVILRWEAPLLRYGKIIEYSVCLRVKNQDNANTPTPELPFLRVYCGAENYAFVENSSLSAAHIDSNPKPAIIFRIAARNEKGYGPATQVRWLQDFDESDTTCSNFKEAKKRLYSQF